MRPSPYPPVKRVQAILSSEFSFRFGAVIILSLLAIGNLGAQEIADNMADAPNAGAVPPDGQTAPDTTAPTTPPAPDPNTAAANAAPPPTAISGNPAYIYSSTSVLPQQGLGGATDTQSAQIT